MTWEQQLLAKINRAADNVADATDDRDALVRRAITAGISPSAIADAARIGRTTVWRIANGQ